MVNEFNQSICDFDRIIVNDGKTILQGYLEVDKDKILSFISNDRNNSNPQVGVLKNRITDENNNELVTESNIGKGSKFGYKKLQVLHFCNHSCLKSWVEKNKNVKTSKSK